MQQTLLKLLSVFGVTNQKPSDEPERPEFDPVSLGPKEVYLEWHSVVKAEVRDLNKRFSRTFIIIAIFIALLLIVMKEFWLIIVVGSLIFFVISLNRLPEHSIPIQVSNHGIKYGENMYYWHDLKRFFFKQVAGGEILIVDTYNYLPGRLFFSYSPEDREKIIQALDKHINYLAIEPVSFLDKLFSNIKDKFNI